ncbi:MAG: hypothetical protein ABIK43_03030 [candidate division WOR-3 bacterium]
MTTTALAPPRHLPAATRRACTLLLGTDILLSATLILVGLFSNNPLLRTILVSAGALFTICFTLLWLALLQNRSWSIAPLAACSALRGLLALAALWLVLVDRRLGAGLGLLAYAELVLALAAVPVLMTAAEHRDTLI